MFEDEMDREVKQMHAAWREEEAIEAEESAWRECAGEGGRE